jgi:antitoxin Phd
MWSVQDAKNRFSAVVEAALAGTPQEVSRRGKPAVVVLSVTEYRRLLSDARASRESFAEHLLSFPGFAVEEADAPFEGARVKPRDVAF